MQRMEVDGLVRHFTIAACRTDEARRSTGFRLRPGEQLIIQVIQIRRQIDKIKPSRRYDLQAGINRAMPHAPASRAGEARLAAGFALEGIDQCQ